MCGIAGVVSLVPGAHPPVPLEQLARMVDAMQHRGPDERGMFRDEQAALVHARLSIIDLAGGQQPMTNEDQSLWVVFNGEIFNYVELRDELLTFGHQFQTNSDTEVIVHAYEQWGDEAFGKFNGQFAIALWHTKRRELVLARDWAGIRPLHLLEHDGRVWFGSEVKAIYAADPSLPRAFDPAGLAETFLFWSIVPPRGVYRHVSEVRPGHVRRYRNGHVTEEPFWNFDFPTSSADMFSGSLQDATDAVRAALEKATELRMVRSDVPVGSYLSGGLDSSIVAAMGVHHKGDTFKTFSLRFSDAEYDETQFQREMVRFVGSDHHEVTVGRKDIAEAFSQVVYHTERPILRTAPAPLFLLSRLVHEQNMKVVLTGEGADEVFAGYDLFREARVRRFWARRPESKCRPKLLERLYPYLARSPVRQRAITERFFGRNLDKWDQPGFSHDTRWDTTSALYRLFADQIQQHADASRVTHDFVDSLPPQFPRWTFLAQDQYIEIRTLLAGYLLSSQGDRMLMANSVEGRFPFLDINVVRLANSLPDKYKLLVLNEKHVLKRAARDIVPASILQRKKQPYRAPDALAFVGNERPEWVDDMMSEQTTKEAGVFAPAAVAALWRKCQRRADAGQFSNTDNMAVVGVLSTHLLHHHFLRSHTTSTPSLSWTTAHDRVGR